MAFDDLYQEIILDHYRNPRNSAQLDHISEDKVHENPTCGDSLKLEVHVNEEGIVEKVHFDGKGCAISMASASMMTELLSGKTLDQVKKIIESFTKTMRGESDPELLTEWGEVAALQGVIQFPLRVKCATLAWHAFQTVVEQHN